MARWGKMNKSITVSVAELHSKVNLNVFIYFFSWCVFLSADTFGIRLQSRTKLQCSKRNFLNYIFKKLPPFTWAGFDLTTRSSSLLCVGRDVTICMTTPPSKARPEISRTRLEPVVTRSREKCYYHCAAQPRPGLNVHFNVVFLITDSLNVEKITENIST
jgi:hypothetical protein